MSDIEDKLRQINGNSTALSSWESDVVASINEIMEAPNSAMTQPQVAVIKAIHRRIFDGKYI